jgi:hypothetical protein
MQIILALSHARRQGRQYVLKTSRLLGETIFALIDLDQTRFGGKSLDQKALDGALPRDLNRQKNYANVTLIVRIKKKRLVRKCEQEKKSTIKSEKTG